MKRLSILMECSHWLLFLVVGVVVVQVDTSS